ncbi:hypothetical protein LAG90_15425 [Marinilongibacter aquaticus]|uniref:3-coathanger stack domain-containing protein n=1 Tax=Marinilongibacter aquaticus TaxID=2975157 RepID=UPI0021BD2B85|nr:3-coathanger stack domain-containing protein [Marinilongibacter aquaticus]UBM58196.1 hypothetical protein LAG90_15425 [Marinilongibacter aquaticus]
MKYKGLFTWLLVLANFVFFQVHAQDKKVPIRDTQFVQTIYDSCQLACNLFPVNRDHLIATNNFDFEAIVDNAQCYTMPADFEAGCLLKYYNQKWVLVRITEGGTLDFKISNSENYDIDAAIWGPIADQDLTNSCETLSNFPVSCDYTANHTELTIENAQVGEYYLLLITNFSNAHTTVQLRQPTGGKVRYSYFCPDDINLDQSTITEQNQNASNSVTLSTKLTAETVNPDGSSKTFSAIGGHNIVLLPGFETESSDVFEANIQVCLNTSEDYTSPSEQVQCEDFQNHTGNIPHLYANAYQNELVGTVFAVTQPEYKTFDSEGWKKMTKIGKDDDSDRYLWAYREAYENPVNVSLRTAEGCPIYADVRTSEIKSYIGEEDTYLPTLSPITNYANIDSPFFLATFIGGNVSTNYDTYLMYLKEDLPNLGYRINGGSWQYNVSSGRFNEEYSNRYVEATKIDYFSAPKDFIMDFTQDAGQTIDRYIVTRNSTGGHFTVTTTFTREADHSVTVNTYQGDMHVPMLLGDTPSYPHFGNTFKLGVLTEGHYKLPFKTEKGEYTLDEGILIRVRYGQNENQ